ncbi:MAG: hypothetical protein HC831_05585 [Chloroflexia bacterium]|nr:hypothetical protein [Chloroflexia bacterium]
MQTVASKFIRSIQREFNIEKLSTKLENWTELPFDEFLKELAKNKIKLSLAQKAEWEDYYQQQSKAAQNIKSEIDKTDKEIDQMVYELYGLSEEEIRIVEESIK